MTSVLCIGEAMVEIALAPDRPDTAGLGFAGDTLNTAIYLKRTAPGLRVAYGTKLGRDGLSDRMIAMIEAEGLDTALIRRSETRVPGLYAINTDGNGERSFTYWRENSAARRLMEPPGLEESDLSGFDLVYLSAISLAILPPAGRARLMGWLRHYRDAGGRVAFDSNYRPALWSDQGTAQETVTDAWRLTDIGLPSLEDELALFGDPDEAALLERLRRYGLGEGVLKRGARGPLPLNGSPPLAIKPATGVVDSTAAGDSFNAGYLAAKLDGMDETESMQAGHGLALRVIGHRGAILPREER
ncbi:2-dehydro-3-deoxygluconokinase [Ruegeria marina]|uniref:2-dehydro-3-deoxygluconokinase n=2 Tax=Ruegeria marina TaxID=639004 RepID=A0A1G6XA61_9RHOB|nr:2-dehydro-3-deoxygluconokinase [Ruegeria marina]